MRIGIIDDERPARSELRLELEDMSEYEMEIQEGDSGASAIRMVTEHPLDLLFLDINLGDMKSTALIPALKKLQPKMMICFVTAYSDYALDAYDLEVDDYVMKPFERERIARVVRKCSNQLSEVPKAPDVNAEPPAGAESTDETPLKQPRRIAVACSDRRVYVDTENLIYIETYQRGCRIYTKNQVLESHQSIGEYEKKLPEFVRIQRSYLVNVHHVREIFTWSKNSVAVRMEYYPEEVLPVSREMVKVLRSRLEE